MVKLLVGLYPPAKGHVKYNSIDSTEIDLLDLRKQLGFVTQDAQLFSGTIRENLLFVKPSATDEELLEVLHKASCDKLLDRAEDGLNTTIGEGGIKVSGGEKQRLSKELEDIKDKYDELLHQMHERNRTQPNATERKKTLDTDKDTDKDTYYLNNNNSADGFILSKIGEALLEGEDKLTKSQKEVIEVIKKQNGN